MTKWLTTQYRSFAHAFRGIGLLWSEYHYKIHIVVFFLVVLASAYFCISPLEWSLVLLASGLVLLSEGVNTAVEKTLDRITKNYDSEVKNIKDISAGFTLVSVFIAIVIGLIIFLPKIKVLNLFFCN